MTPEIDDRAWLARWELVPDGEAISTPSGLLLPVRWRGQPAMLKIAYEEEEQRGGRLMTWWDGDGAARVLAHDDRALLLERITCPRSLAEMVAAGADDEASRILCSTAARLHAPRRRPPPELMPLSRWFEALSPAAAVMVDFLPRPMRQRANCWPRRARSCRSTVTSIMAMCWTPAFVAGLPSIPRAF